MVLSCAEGNLSDFFRDLNSLLARALNTKLGRGENLWSSDGLKRSLILGEVSPWDQLVYCAVQPTKDGLVPDPRQWPGLISQPEDVGATVFRFERPDEFFRSEGDEALPEVVEFELEVPVELDHMDPAEFRHAYRRLLDERIASVLDERARAGKPFLGRQQVLDQDPLAAAGDTWPARDLDPRVACKDKQIRPGALRWLSEFRFAHTVAWTLWSHGYRDVEFPYGTYWMRTRYQVRCRDPVTFTDGETALSLAA